MRCANWLSVLLWIEVPLFAAPERVASLDIGPGYRVDHFKLSGTSEIEGLPYNIDFSSVQIVEVAALFETNRCSPLFFSLLGKHGWVVGGDEEGLSLFDLDINDKTSYQSETKASSLGGDTNDVEAKIGYRFHFCDKRGFMAPVMGVTYDKFHIFEKKYWIDIEVLNRVVIPTTLDASPLESDVYLKGLLVGLEGDYQFLSCWNLSGGVAWNWFKSKTLRQSGGKVIGDDDTTLSLLVKSSESEVCQGINTHLALFYKKLGGWEVGLLSAFRYVYATGGAGITLGAGVIQESSTTLIITGDSFQHAKHLHWSSFSIQLMAGYRF